MGFPRIGSSGGFQRQPEFNRKPLGFQDDGKLHAVLDTNIPVYAMWALNNGEAASELEKACLGILDAVRDGRIAMGLTARLKDEYLKVAARHVESGTLRREYVDQILNIIAGKNVADFRLLVDHAGYVQRDSDDDTLFNGLSGDYLISADRHVAAPNSLDANRSAYGTIIKPIDFVRTVLDA